MKKETSKKGRPAEKKQSAFPSCKEVFKCNMFKVYYLIYSLIGLALTIFLVSIDLFNNWMGLLSILFPFVFLPVIISMLIFTKGIFVWILSIILIYFVAVGVNLVRIISGRRRFIFIYAGMHILSILLMIGVLLLI